MLFNSLKFAIFLPVVFILFWLCPQRFRWCVLLVSSYYFYMSWNVAYVALIVIATVISYTMALLISRIEKTFWRKICVGVACCVSLSILFVFKYYNFFVESLVELLRSCSVNCNLTTLSILLPVGISFYTFQTLSYVIDVYRGNVAAEYHFGRYATFVAFFPQLVAGPIERSGNLLPQINKVFQFDYKAATYGLKLMAWGFFKKIVIADTFARYVDLVYDNVYGYSGFVYVIAAVMFSIQIYCDFSGYSDIAIGVAKLFDINLMQNFSAPYFSASIKEFWSRWHISLSTWFRDYVYIPLGGNRVSPKKHKFNLLVTFLVSGLWHGANWTFVVWGAMHGLAQIVEGKRKECSNSIQKAGRTVVVFMFVCLAWFFFRAASINDAFYILSEMFTGMIVPAEYIAKGISDMGINYFMKRYLALVILILSVYDYLSLKYDVIEKISSIKSTSVRWMVYIIFTVFLFFGILLQYSERPNAFVYFQF